jgi:hypothetical protein
MNGGNNESRPGARYISHHRQRPVDASADDAGKHVAHATQGPLNLRHQPC